MIHYLYNQVEIRVGGATARLKFKAFNRQAYQTSNIQTFSVEARRDDTARSA